MSYVAKLNEMGIEIKEPVPPLASYIPAVQCGNLVFTSGQIPMKDGKLLYTGKVGAEVTPEQAKECAKLCAINCLSAIKGVIGDLDKIEAVFKVTGFVNSAAGFNAQPAVINGASDFFGEVFGDAGKHARSAVGVSDLPIDAPVEVEVIVKLKD